MDNGTVSSADRPTIMVTNDDGIDAPGLQALVRILVSANRFNVQVCAPDSEKSAVSHSITYRHPLAVKRVVSGINMGSNCGYDIVYSGTVAGAREAFLNGVPSIALSYDWMEGRSDIQDFTLAAEACLPIISAILAEIKRNNYPKSSFLSIDVPTDVSSHKGYKMTKQGRKTSQISWTQVNFDVRGGKMLSTMTVDTDSPVWTEADSLAMSEEHILFKREVWGHKDDDDDEDHPLLKEGYITVTPIGALSPPAAGFQAFVKDWLPTVTACPPSTL